MNLRFLNSCAKNDKIQMTFFAKIFAKLQKNETFFMILKHCEVGFYCIGKRSDKEEEEWQAPFGLLANYTEYLE